MESDTYILIAEKSGYRKTGQMVDLDGDDVEVKNQLKKKTGKSVQDRLGLRA